MQGEKTHLGQREASECQPEERLSSEASRVEDFLREQATGKGKGVAVVEAPEARPLGEDGRPRQKEVVLTDQQGLLGGTKEEAQAYLNSLPRAQRNEFDDYNRMRWQLTSQKIPEQTKHAKNSYPEGYEINKEYNRIRQRGRKRGTGESSQSAQKEASEIDLELKLGR